MTNFPSISQISVAALHSSANGNAAFAYREMERAFDRGDAAAAHRWMLRTVQYAVGIFHEDYRFVSGRDCAALAMGGE